MLCGAMCDAMRRGSHSHANADACQEDPTRYKWTDGLSRLEGLWGFGYDYGTGG